MVTSVESHVDTHLNQFRLSQIISPKYETSW